MKLFRAIIFVAILLTGCAAKAQVTSSGGATASGGVRVAAPDTTAPTISSGPTESALTTTSVTIGWVTNELSTTQICLRTSSGGADSCNSEINTSPSFVTTHSDDFTGLTAGTQYWYVVKSRDASGNLVTSAEGDFTTTASGGGGVLEPTCGSTSSTGSVDNSSRSNLIASHWSTTQALPSLAVGANAVVGNGTSTVITVTTDPTSGAPRFYVGGRVNLDVTDAAADGNFTITAVNSTTITVSSSFNGTTGTGTVKAIMYADLAEGGTLTDPVTGCVQTKLINGSVPSYSGWNAFNYNETLMLAYDLTASTFKIIRLSDRAVICSTSNLVTAGVFGEGANPRWGRTSGTGNTLYFASFNSNILKKLADVTSSCTSVTNVKTFAGYTAIDIGGGEGDITLDSNGDETAAIRGCSVSFACSSGTRELFHYNITDDVKGTVRDISADSPDNYRACPDGKMIYQTGSAMLLLNNDGTTSRTVGNNNYHTSSCVEGPSGGMFVVIDLGSNDDASITTSPDCEPGYIAVNVATGVGTCMWNNTNSNASGGACNSVVTHSCNQNGHISIGGNNSLAILTINNDSFANASEASIAATWDTSWARGTSEVVACKLDGTGCWRLAHLRRGGGSSYRKSPKCSSSMAIGLVSGSAPKYVACAVDWRDGSGDTGTDTILITVR